MLNNKEDAKLIRKAARSLEAAGAALSALSPEGFALLWNDSDSVTFVRGELGSWARELRDALAGRKDDKSGD